jgi:hypothetical protein
MSDAEDAAAVEKRVQLALDALKKIYPKTDIAGHIIGDPITVSWEADPHFLGAFKARCPATTATTSACTRTSCNRTCPPSSACLHRR